MRSRSADEVKVAQRFIAGVRSGDRTSPRSGRLKVTEPRAVASGIKTQAQKVVISQSPSCKLSPIPRATARGSVPRCSCVTSRHAPTVKFDDCLENSIEVQGRLKANLCVHFRDVGNAPRHVFKAFYVSFVVRNQHDV